MASAGRKKTPGAATTPTEKKSTPKMDEAKGSKEGRSPIKSKIGSMDNATHQPGGGATKVLNQSSKYEGVQSKCGSMDNYSHKAKGGDKKIESRKLEWKAESKVGSLDRKDYTPGGGKKKIENHKLDFKEKAQAKCGSLDNAQHKAGGGATKSLYRSSNTRWKSIYKPDPSWHTSCLTIRGLKYKNKKKMNSPWRRPQQAVDMSGARELFNTGDLSRAISNQSYADLNKMRQMAGDEMKTAA